MVSMARRPCQIEKSMQLRFSQLQALCGQTEPNKGRYETKTEGWPLSVGAVAIA
jgi:hypothetical protein